MQITQKVVSIHGTPLAMGKAVIELKPACWQIVSFSLLNGKASLLMQRRPG
jgi:hypothetical protein